MKMDLTLKSLCGAAALFAGLSASTAFADDANPVRNRTISYATMTMHWSVYQTADAKAECPNGLNDYGPREVFKSYFGDGKGKSVVESQLAREGFKYFPLDANDGLPYNHAGGKISNGINLDGKVKDGDFTNQEGEKGVDNNLFRVIGCARIYRGPDGAIFFFATKQVRDYTFNRTMIEITDVDSLADDPDVTVTFYRGQDPLMQDASGSTVLAGGTQRPDMRFGKSLIRRMKGKIEGGTLLTDAIDNMMVPWEVFPPVPDYLIMRGARFSLKLAPERAEGVLAGYADIERLYAHATTWSTHHFSYGQHDAPRYYRELYKMADGFPNKDGVNTAISSALQFNMIQVYIDHGEPKTAGGSAPLSSEAPTRASRE
jgi:hypothetical protein